MGMVVIFTGFISLFNELGFGAAIIQRKEIHEQHLSSVFWLNIVMGVVIMLGLIAAADLIATFYNEPRLIALTRVLSLNFLIGAFSPVRMAILKRAMNFKLLAILEFIAALCAGIAAIVLALNGFGVWSLVWQSLCRTTVQVVVMWIYIDWHPQFRFRYRAIQELWKFGKNLTGFNVLNYWVRNVDNFLIGKFVGSYGLGMYARAYSAMLLPLSQVTSVIRRVMFPALSKIQEDRQKVKLYYLQLNRVIGLLTFPMVCGLFVTASPFVATLYGQKWEPAIPIIQILCLIAIKQPVGSTAGLIFAALGRTDIQLKWGIISAIVAIIAFVIGIQWGVMGVAIAYVIRGYLLHYHGIIIPGRLIGMSFKEFHLNVAGIFACAVTMAILVWGVGVLLPNNWQPWIYLAIQVPCGMLVYWGLIHLFRVKAYQEVQELMKDHILRRPGTMMASSKTT